MTADHAGQTGGEREVPVDDQGFEIFDWCDETCDEDCMVDHRGEE